MSLNIYKILNKVLDYNDIIHINKMSLCLKLKIKKRIKSKIKDQKLYLNDTNKRDIDYMRLKAVIKSVINEYK